MINQKQKRKTISKHVVDTFDPQRRMRSIANYELMNDDLTITSSLSLLYRLQY